MTLLKVVYFGENQKIHWVSLTVQGQLSLALHTTTWSKSLHASCLGSWLTGITLHMK